MGDNYFVKIKMRPKGCTEKDLAKDIESWIRKHDGTWVRFDKKKGQNLDGTLMQALDVVFPNVEKIQKELHVKGRPFDGYEAQFDASFGWMHVMEDVFTVMGKHLEPGSRIRILPGSGRKTGVVNEDGSVSWHWYDN